MKYYCKRCNVEYNCPNRFKREGNFLVFSHICNCDYRGCPTDKEIKLPLYFFQANKTEEFNALIEVRKNKKEKYLSIKSILDKRREDKKRVNREMQEEENRRKEYEKLKREFEGHKELKP